MVNDAKCYENMHETLLTSIQGCSDLAFDILAFSCLSKLADSYSVGENPFDGEGGQAKWLQNLTDFMGSFFKRNPNIDIKPLLTYICNMIRDEK